MVRYMDDRFDEDYMDTLGLCVNFWEKIIHLKNVEVYLNIWDLGGSRDYWD